MNHSKRSGNRRTRTVEKTDVSPKEIYKLPLREFAPLAVQRARDDFARNEALRDDTRRDPFWFFLRYMRYHNKLKTETAATAELYIEKLAEDVPEVADLLAESNLIQSDIGPLVRSVWNKIATDPCSDPLVEAIRYARERRWPERVRNDVEGLMLGVIEYLSQRPGDGLIYLPQVRLGELLKVSDKTISRTRTMFESFGLLEAADSAETSVRNSIRAAPIAKRWRVHQAMLSHCEERLRIFHESQAKCRSDISLD